MHLLPRLLLLLAPLPLALAAEASPLARLAELERALAAAGAPAERGDVVAIPLLTAQLQVDGDLVPAALFASDELAAIGAPHVQQFLRTDDRALYVSGPWVLSLSELDEPERKRLVDGMGLKPAAPLPPPLKSAATPPTQTPASASLKSGLFPAQVQVQMGGFIDQDADGKGEFAFFPELSGARRVGKDSVELMLIAKTFQQAEPVVDGYRFAIHLPAGPDRAMVCQADGTRPALDAATQAEAISLQERYWVAYAWPEVGSGEQFAISQKGIVYRRLADGKPPAWNSLSGASRWDDERVAPGWEPVAPRR